VGFSIWFILPQEASTLPISSSEDPDDFTLLFAPALVLLPTLPRLAVLPLSVVDNSDFSPNRLTAL
jgi:hypothetical protein